jgi:hypothetical protein
MDIFQLTQADIDRSSTLDADDVGKWCFLVRGCLFGFFPTREEALAKLESVKGFNLSP